MIWYFQRVMWENSSVEHENSHVVPIACVHNIAIALQKSLCLGMADILIYDIVHT